MLWWRLCLLITDFDGIVAHAPLPGTASDALTHVPGCPQLTHHKTIANEGLRWPPGTSRVTRLAGSLLRSIYEKRCALNINKRQHTIVSLWRAKREEVELANMRFQRRPESDTRDDAPGPNNPQSYSRRPLGSQELVSYGQGWGVVVLCSGDLLERADWKSKYAFHLYKTWLHPPSALLCSKRLHSLPKSEASELCQNKANDGHCCHWTCILGSLAMPLV